MLVYLRLGKLIQRSVIICVRLDGAVSFLIINLDLSGNIDLIDYFVLCITFQ